MADEIAGKLLERVKEQGELVRRLKAAKADDIEVRKSGFASRTLEPFFYLRFMARSEKTTFWKGKLFPPYRAP